MSKLRYSQITVHNGEVIATNHTDWLESVDFEEMVMTIQQNVRRSYWDVVDTKDGVVHVSIEGLVTVWTVQTGE